MPGEPETARLIVRPVNPERLDRMLHVSTSLSWLGLWTLILALASAFVWSCISTAPVKVVARGMLLSSLGIADIPATADGRLTEVRVRVGDVVRKGDVVAEIGQPETSDRLQSKALELSGLNGERQRLVDFQSRVAARQEQLARDRRAGLEARVASLTSRIAALADIERNTQTLVDKGYELRTRLLSVTNDRTSAQDELAQARVSLVQLATEQEAQATQNAREILAVDMKIAGAQREAEVLTDLLKRATKVYAPADGTIVEAAANPNEPVHAGAPIMRMLPAADRGEEPLRAMIYVGDEDGKRIRPGMAVQIIPANARLERDGYIEARVAEVANLPATRESMLRVLKNAALVEQLAGAGPPFEVAVELERDPASPTGFRWSTGRGTPRPPESGTMAEAKFVVDRIPLIALVVPRAETVLVWLRNALS